VRNLISSTPFTSANVSRKAKNDELRLNIFLRRCDILPSDRSLIPYMVKECGAEEVGSADTSGEGLDRYGYSDGTVGVSANWRTADLIWRQRTERPKNREEVESDS